MSFRPSVRTLQLVCLCSTLLFIALDDWTWRNLAGGLIVYAVFLIFGVAIGLHRGLSHRILEPDSKLGWFSLAVGTLTTLGKPVEWALIHRMHHQHSDTDADPHSPLRQGFWAVFSNTWRLSEAAGRPRVSLVRDLVSSKSVQFYQQHYYMAIGLYISILFFSFGITGVVFGYCLPVSLCVLATSLVNSVCHLGGEGKDSFWISFLTFGEGIHGRHHREPKTVNLSHGVYFDLAGWLLAKWISVHEEEVVWALRQRKQK
jgi:fatty-acid desaturase